MNLLTKLKIASFFWPKRFEIVELLNVLPEIKKWAMQHRIDTQFSDRSQYFAFLNEIVVGTEPIDFLEFGVYRGDSLKEWAELNTNANSRFFGFDTFMGLPDKWLVSRNRGMFSTEGVIPDIRDLRVKVIQGLFQESLDSFLNRYIRSSRLVIHADADLYSSTLYILTSLSHLLQRGDLILFDEFCTPPEFKAYSDFVMSYKVKMEPIAIATEHGLPLHVAFMFQ